jgi:hypothetical protein
VVGVTVTFIAWPAEALQFSQPSTARLIVFAVALKVLTAPSTCDQRALLGGA